MKFDESLKREIIEALKSLRPQHMILFGGYANGNVREESDLDLYIVTGDSSMPRTWVEKKGIVLPLSRGCADFNGGYLSISSYIRSRCIVNSSKGRVVSVLRPFKEESL